MRLSLRKPTSAVLVLMLAVLISGCGKAGVQTATPMSAGGSMILIKASGHKFSPNRVSVEKPGLLAVEIRNASGSEHNFTLKDPHGKVLKSIDIKPSASAIVNLELNEPGVYRFYCNKRFHASLGMKGEITVGR